MALDSVTSNSMMEGHQLTDEDRNKQISDIHLEQLNTHCSKWRHLPAHLQMASIVVKDIDRNPGDEMEKRYNFFKEWKETKGSAATYKTLISALFKIGCREDAEYVCKLIQPSSPNSNCTAPTQKTPAAIKTSSVVASATSDVMEPSSTASTQAANSVTEPAVTTSPTQAMPESSSSISATSEATGLRVE